MDHPYKSLPATAFWRSGVVDPGPYGLRDVWSPKYAISKKDRVVTAGSCFAQNIGRALKAKGYNWYDAEPAPARLSKALEYNYGVFSFRTANIYTTALLRQWLDWAVNGCADTEIWTEDGRYFDPVRPSIEPGGFSSPTEMFASRATTLRAIKEALSADVFIFTLGLTEAWYNRDTGLVYSSCPGTIAGEFDPDIHHFVNYPFQEVARDLAAAIALAHSVNPDLRFLLTVSPVSLTATASGQHALVANSYTKSLLRAVAGEAIGIGNVDYFPSYEMMTSPPFRSMFYASNMRQIVPDGVTFVMDNFFRDMNAKFPDGDANEAGTSPAGMSASIPKSNDTDDDDDDDDDVICEEMMLEDFNRA